MKCVSYLFDFVAILPNNAVHTYTNWGIQEDFIRASGPGGQNVNKVATAVQLRFDVAHSNSLPEEVRQRLIKLAGNWITEEGIIVIDARRFRTQVQSLLAVYTVHPIVAYTKQPNDDFSSWYR